MSLKIKLPKIKNSDLFVGLVVISSIALRNYQYLLYIIQAIFLLLYTKPLVKGMSKEYFLFRGLFLLIAMGSMLWARSLSATLSVIPAMLQIYVLCVILSGYLYDHEQIEKFIKIIALSSIVLVINLMIATPFSEWKEVITYSQSGNVNVSSSSARLGRSVGMHPNTFAVVIAVCFLACFYIFYKNKKKTYLVWLVVLLAILLLSKSRATLITTFLGIFLIYFFQQQNSMKKIKVLIYGLGGLLVAMWALFNIPILYDIVGYRMEGLLNIFGTTSEIDASTTTRLEFILIALRLFAAHPIVGVGMNNFSTIAYSDYSIWAETYSHCNYTEILSGIGLIGFIFYYGILFTAFINLVKIRRNSKTTQREVYSTVSFLIAIMLTCLILDISHVTYDNECIQFIELLCICGSSVFKKKLKENENEEKNNMLLESKK